jgi:SAM-dependent methyltransferase
MTEYAFVLGSNWLLSIAELLEYVQDRGIDSKLVDNSRNIVILDIPERLETDSIIDLQSALGGCFKVAQVLLTHERDSAASAYPSKGRTNKRQLKSINDVRWAKRVWPHTRGKRIRFGVSTYPLVNGRAEGVNYRKFTKKLNDQLKGWLMQNHAKRADYYTYSQPDRRVSGRLNVSLWPKTIQRNNLLSPPNAEIIAAFTERKLYIARTLIVYDSVLQQYRDESRPFISSEISTSPKVCRTLLTLAGARPGDTILDPFCGTGTVLMEAALLGMKCIGLDIDGNQVQGAMSNLRWLAQDLGQKLDFTVVRGDARETSKIIKGQIDAVAFEPHLGPVYTEKPDPEAAIEETKSLTKLYRATLEEMVNVLRPDGRIAMTLPVINTRRGQVKIDVQRMLHGTGLIVHPLIPSEMIASDYRADKRAGIRPERGQLPERKRGQIVQRSMVVFEK